MSDNQEIKESWTARPNDAHGWKEVDLGTGDSSIKKIDPDKRVTWPEGLEPGHKLKLVRSEELWATDPQTGECMDLIHRQTYIREASAEEQAYIEMTAMHDGIQAIVLSQHFN